MPPSRSRTGNTHAPWPDDWLYSMAMVPSSRPLSLVCTWKEVCNLLNRIHNRKHVVARKEGEREQDSIYVNTGVKQFLVNTGMLQQYRSATYHATTWLGCLTSHQVYGSLATHHVWISTYSTAHISMSWKHQATKHANTYHIKVQNCLPGSETSESNVVKLTAPSPSPPVSTKSQVRFLT